MQGGQEALKDTVTRAVVLPVVQPQRRFLLRAGNRPAREPGTGQAETQEPARAKAGADTATGPARQAELIV